MIPVHRWIVFTAVTSLAAVAYAEPPDKAADLTVPVVVQSTIATAGDDIRQLAFDGDRETYFSSSTNPTVTDHFTLVFDKPVDLKSIEVLTGLKERENQLESGLLELSEDGKAFSELARFADGTARGKLEGKKALALRIRPDKDQDHPLAIREIVIESDPAVVTFRYPVEFVVDVSDAPEMKDWAEKVAAICTRAYPMINEELKSDGFKPARVIQLALKSDYTGVAFASRNRITGSVKFFKDHPDDVGAMVHETAHVVQRYRGRNNPGWLVEGVADYVRFFRFEPDNIGPINPARARYNASYRVSAAFLAYCVEKYDAGLVRKLNQAMREGKYKDELFEEMTKKTLPQLDEEWRATLRK